ncbi:hypothetical protein AB0K87_01610 [Streptomyces sp. NPDC053705]|uniref:hypothetical protein n=1 Tax=Streptomyces TaxID=1883 RepID=UPI00342B95CE
MDVTLSPDGSHSPQYDETWPRLTQLEWHAGIVALDTGLTIRVRDAADDLYSVSVKSGGGLSGNGPMGFHEAWAFLDGVKVGARHR